MHRLAMIADTTDAAGKYSVGAARFCGDNYQAQNLTQSLTVSDIRISKNRHILCIRHNEPYEL